MSERPVVIFGGKGSAINVAEQIENARRLHAYPMKVVGFAIDEPPIGHTIAGFPVVSGVMSAWETLRATDVAFIFALYRPDVMPARLALLRSLGIPRERFANFIHPTSYVSSSVVLGHGNVIMSQCTLQHGVSVGNFNVINSNVVIEHDSRVGDGAFLAAGACVGAHVQIEDSVFVGLNATVREDVVVGADSFIGMGSCVLRSLEPDTIAYGVPARPAK